MRTKNKINCSLVLLSIVIASCKKQETTVPPSLAEFTTTSASASYFIQNDPASAYKIPVGFTTIAGSNRTITYSVTSPTGATAGTQYTIASAGSIVIPAGKAVDSITVKGLFAGYPSGRRDTLIFKITGGDGPAAGFNNAFSLIVQKACAVVSTDLTGAYTQSTDTYNGAASTQPKYTATISNWTALTATSATVVIKNLGATSDNGWGPFSVTDAASTPGLTATLNWSNPGNQTVTIAAQNYFGSGSSVSTISGTGTFSSCDQTFTVVCSVKYAPNGNTYVHTSILKR